MASPPPTLAAPAEAPTSCDVAPPPLGARDALLLDFDGTLVALADDPESIRPDPSLIPLLGGLQGALDGAVALISGRRLESLDRWLAPLQFAGAGLHGAQPRLQPGPPPAMDRTPALARLASTLRQTFAHAPGVRIEDKGAALALHYRQAPDQGEACRRHMQTAATGLGYDLLAGHDVFELRPPGIDKGAALRAILQAPAFSGRRPVFVGDDVTDEDAIRAAQALGGIGVRVGPGASAALYRLDDSTAVLAWLQRSEQALRSALRRSR